MRLLQSTIDMLERRRDRVLAELHSELRVKVEAVIADTGGRLTPWEGYRDAIGQARARATGASNASFGKSPHNFRPALACDLVLHPARVAVRERWDSPGLPDLWDDESPEALSAWQALEAAAIRQGLGRVMIRDIHSGARVRDRPHVQLTDWRGYLVTA